ncbi:MAG: bifunctional hydroxymethylpyrimidine kinase/phosphomethylpyrimidine kinase [Solirubrobacterales bacterium]
MGVDQASDGRAAGGRTPVALSIAGSDSGGGAGIQADLKAFASCGVHGTTAITAITAQNTVGVLGVEPVSPQMIEAQVEAVASDIGVDAIKVGMLGSAPTAMAVVRALGLTEGPPVVVDPVMVAESGAALLDPEARDVLIAEVLPKAMVATPNIPEARELTGLGEGADQEELARAVLALGPAAVVVTGGHSVEGVDLLVTGESVVRIEGDLHPSGTSHGSGCTHSSALAAGLARGLDVEDSARLARRVASRAVLDGLREVGAGAGPVDALGIRVRSVEA